MKQQKYTANMISIPNTSFPNIKMWYTYVYEGKHGKTCNNVTPTKFPFLANMMSKIRFFYQEKLSISRYMRVY